VLQAEWRWAVGRCYLSFGRWWVKWVQGIVETYDTTKKPLVYEQRVLLGAR